ncbi:hybrid sensor histidine kinase/response regulator [Cylindrospermum sp. FACHB-282]|uniref:hybrid sensor histidine kinase/response regulator n=1 Tax=Cylindrospermum sp. FACHB-282 TaxID=2692794 RepID=UPI001688ADE2|nr:PAS domain S-box protein [Cylindrospermum sp. FACHB-282]MBD2385841.1 PAS domain S-box protein [Cylindrospermum sp. FACHB-282]
MKSFGCNKEAARLEALHQYQILDTAPEQVFDDLVLLTAQICDTPIALINLIDGNRQWFKAKVGLDVQEMPISMGFCPLCMAEADVLIIPDTLADEKFAREAVVTSEPYVRFYAGVPLILPSGETIGTLCVIDRVPRQIMAKQLSAMQSISRLVIRQLEIRRNLAELASIKREYKQAQEALYQSESTLHSFFESAPMMMGIVELVENDILHITNNPATTKFLGLTPDAMQNRLARELGVAQKQLSQWIHYYRQAEHSQSPIKFEYSHETPQGQKWLSVTVSAIAKNNGNRQQFAYVIEDITDRLAARRERRRAEEKLRWKEALLSSMNSVSPLAFYVVDNRSDDILYFNERFCEIWGLEHLKELMESQELKNQEIISDCLKFIADIPAFAASYQPLQSEENCCIVEDEIYFNDGRIIRRFSTQIRDYEAQYFGRLYIFEDITARKQVEQQIREQAALLDITTDAIVVQDLDNKILLWNKSAEKLYGWQAEEAIGKNVTELLDNEPLPQHREIYQTVLQHGSWQGELQRTRKSGAEIIVESCWTLVRDERLLPKSILIVDTDITQKKQLEKQFLRAQRMESIGTLASGIAHDLNNVLSPILMSVHLLRNKLHEPQIHQVLSIVEGNAKRGANLVKQVLSFARGIEGDRTIVQIKHLILEMQQIVEQTFPKSITIHTKIQPDLLPVCGDSTQLHQVLMNLCLNARDAMPKGGTLSICAENILIDQNYAKMHLDAQVGSYIVIQVTDTGVGIEGGILDRIFEPFFTTKEFGKGTGLGLSTVVGIIKGHGGFITVSSALGKGTNFLVYLPTVNTPATQFLEDIEMPTGNGEWILLVDDEAAIREITTTSLESYNYKVITASDGIKGIALYSQNKDKIRAAIIDLMMPNMDGVTTIRTLQNMNPLLPIIAVSGLATSEQIPFNQTSRSIAFLPKPFTAQELLKALQAVKG